MAKRIIFRKIGGKLRPIRISDTVKDIAAAGAVISGATLVANKIRKISARSIIKKDSFGTLPNLAIELGISAAIAIPIAKKYRRVFKGFHMLGLVKLK